MSAPKKAAHGVDEDASITLLLGRFASGDRTALDELYPLVYQRLRRLAARKLDSERPGHTLQATALVHEAFLSLSKQDEKQWRDRGHFFAVASLAMRQILVAHARKRLAEKRGGNQIRVAFVEEALVDDRDAVEVVALDAALVELEKENPRQARIVELRFFGGMSIEETATAMELSTGTIKREWNVARAWLFQKLAERANES